MNALLKMRESAFAKWANCPAFRFASSYENSLITNVRAVSVSPDRGEPKIIFNSMKLLGNFMAGVVTGVMQK